MDIINQRTGSVPGAKNANTQDLVAQLRAGRFAIDEVAEIANQAADEIERLMRELDEAKTVLAAAANLATVKGRHNTAIAYQRLVSALDSRRN